VQQKLGGFLKTLPDIPFQQGSGLNARNVNYDSLQATEAMKRLGQVEGFVKPPRN